MRWRKFQSVCLAASCIVFVASGCAPYGFDNLPVPSGATELKEGIAARIVEASSDVEMRIYRSDPEATWTSLREWYAQELDADGWQVVDTDPEESHLEWRHSRWPFGQSTAIIHEVDGVSEGSGVVFALVLSE